MPPPTIDSTQKATGMTLRPSLSLSIHCTRKRPAKTIWAHDAEGNPEIEAADEDVVEVDADIVREAIEHGT